MRELFLCAVLRVWGACVRTLKVELNSLTYISFHSDMHSDGARREAFAVSVRNGKFERDTDEQGDY
jgi:hypothetical protein